MYGIPEIAIKPASAGFFFAHILPRRELSGALFVAADQDDRDEGNQQRNDKRREEYLRRPPAVSANRMVGGEKDFSGLRGTQAASGLPAHR